jgi:hypothetical protein
MTSVKPKYRIAYDYGARLVASVITRHSLQEGNSVEKQNKQIELELAWRHIENRVDVAREDTHPYNCW